MPNKKRYDLSALYFPKRIMNKLELLTAYPMTVVEAPSGFGKTTAVREFFKTYAGDGIPVYWHTFLGESFSASWQSLCSLFAHADQESAGRLAEMGTPDEEAIPLITEILENMECAEETYIVLDNFQDARVPFVRSLLEAFAKQGGEKFHVVVLTQQLSLEGTLFFNQNNRVYRINSENLAFTKEDAAGYYRQAGLRIAPEQLDGVYARCDGWIAALYLQMLAYVQTGSFERGDMETLLHTAMWGRLSPDEQTALMTLAIFPSFTLSQAQYIAAPIKLSEEMLRVNPFIRFDRETRSFYMHSILKGYLFSRFEGLPEAGRNAAYLRGGDWFSKTKQYIEALRFYHRSGDYEKIFALPLTSLDVADHAIREDIRPIILELLDDAGDEIKLRYPQTVINLAFALFFLGEHRRLVMQREAIGGIIENCALSDREKRALAGEMELLMSFLEYNKIDKMSEKHIKALELIGAPTSLININSTWTFGSPSILYMYYRESGKLAEELEQMDECMPHYYRLSGGHGSGAEIVMRAEAQFNAGNPDEAEVLCHKALFVSDSKGQNSIYQCGLLLLARIAILRGDLENLRTIQAAMRERAKRSREDLCRHTIDLCEGFISAALGEDENLAPWLSEGSAMERYLSMMAVPFAHIIYGRALLERKEYAKLLGAGAYFIGSASVFPNLLPQLYAKIYMAQANAALGKEVQAVELLADALNTALPDKLYMPFAENGAGLKWLLPLAAAYVADKEGLLKIEELACSFHQAVQRLKANRPSLTKREQEVYELIARGLTNKDIAERLFVSPATVKTHVSHILEKLGVTSRTQLGEQKRV